ncbi:hypothetical protein GCM10007036_13980 [Alsobacter metallidurans]|uniref:Uncharacterized protein n=1 Tax=Alsobacter metallidurans TaxID=340221 RepID=A0A917MGF3_9HYPH|nr:hypothetical protein [Alsobacter metallidurans]GGH14575.1 hypothetical protein GCM10007036_13980 [Alsobacter metallidurans]
MSNDDKPLARRRQLAVYERNKRFPTIQPNRDRHILHIATPGFGLPKNSREALDRSEEPNLAVILQECLAKHMLMLRDVVSNRQTPDARYCRMEFYSRARHETLHSYPVIAHFICRKDHTAAMHGVRRFAAMRQSGLWQRYETVLVARRELAREQEARTAA